VKVHYLDGVRLDGLTLDPTRKVDSAFWTHRPARRTTARHTLASAPLAASWPGVLGLPFGRGALAMGHRVELLPTGYGVGGAAPLFTRDGERTLAVGPTTEALVPRQAHRLVLAAPAPPGAPEDWLQTALETPGRLVVPDAAAAADVIAALEAEGIRPRRPSWLGASPRQGDHAVSLRAPGTVVDARPQASEAWLVAFATACSPDVVQVHGPRAQALAAQLASAGLNTRVLHGPQQLTLLQR
jgi:hypothetical protein